MQAKNNIPPGSVIGTKNKGTRLGYIFPSPDIGAEKH